MDGHYPYTKKSATTQLCKLTFVNCMKQKMQRYTDHLAFSSAMAVARAVETVVLRSRLIRSLDARAIHRWSFIKERRTMSILGE